MSTHNLGIVDMFGAEALGQPGQRRFRLFISTKTTSAFLWLEKEQLLGLSLAIDRALALISDGQVLRVEAQVGGLLERESDLLPRNFPARPDYDIQIGQLRLNYDEEHGMFALVALPFEIREDEDREPHIFLNSDDAFSLLFTIEQGRHLSSRITFLATGGRPVCPLCHQPLDGGPHTCINQNGHREVLQILEDEGDEEDEEDETDE